MPGQISNIEKAFRKVNSTIGTIASVADQLSFIVPPLAPLIMAIDYGSMLGDVGFTIADLIRNTEGTHQERANKVFEIIGKTMPGVSTAAKIGEMAETAIPAIFNDRAGGGRGISSPDMESFNQAAQKFIYGGPAGFF
jgi:hypothetical protein